MNNLDFLINEYHTKKKYSKKYYSELKELKTNILTLGFKQGLTKKEISLKVQVSEQTIINWIRDLKLVGLRDKIFKSDKILDKEGNLIPSKITQLCPKHGLTAFSFVKGRKYYCLKCVAERTATNIEKRTLERKKIIEEYRLQECSKCGFNSINSALEYHHINPEDKLFTISAEIRKKDIQILLKEIDKCVLICSSL